MKDRFTQLYMDWAIRVADMSYARRLKVGAVIVKDDLKDVIDRLTWVLNNQTGVKE
jgi:hypothetical protein